MKDNKETREDIFSCLKRVISNLLKASQESNSLKLPEITSETDLVDDLGLDSVELLDLTTAISEEFKVNISERQLINVKTVGDIVSCIVEVKNSN